MNLDNFENYIDPAILRRGLDYFKGGKVADIKMLDEHDYEAEVSGTEDYFVSVELDGDKNIIYSECDCPCDGGPYCKHEAAVFYALRNMHEASPASNSRNGKVIALKAEKPESLEKLLLKQSKERLVKFLADLAAEREDVSLKIRLEFDSYNYKKRFGDCVSLIRRSIDRHSDRQGFVNYYDVVGAMEGAEQVMEMAEKAAEDMDYLWAVDLYLCVIHELIPLLKCSDDSDGYISGHIDSCISSIDIISIEDFGEYVSKELFRRLLKESKNKVYDDWDDWKMSLLDSCITLASSPNEVLSLEAQLESLIQTPDDSWSSQYYYERVMNLKHSHILFHYGEEAANDFTNQNLSLPSFRERAINNALYLKQYELAESLALDGEELSRSLPGRVNDFKELRYAIYSQSNQLEKQRSLAMEFILQGSFEHYKRLKETYDRSEWPSIYPDIIKKLSPERGYKQNYTDILVEEKEFLKLLEYVSSNPRYILQFYKHLLKDYREEVYRLFEAYILEESRRAAHRNAYRKVADIIKLLAKAGGKDEAKDIKEKLFSLYPRRPAFRDELERIRF